VFARTFHAEQGPGEGEDEEGDEEAAEEEDEPFVDFSLGAEAGIDPEKKHEGGEIPCLAAKAKEEMEENRERDGGKEPGGDGMGEKNGHINES
jgi:hypothetical protein